MLVEESILINADLDKVWDTFTNLTCWKDWNSVIRDAKAEEGCISSGSCIYCNFKPFFFTINVKIEVKDVRLKERISWHVNKFGLIAEHLFVFSQRENGVLVTSKETFNGFLVKNALFIIPKQKIIHLTRTFLKELKRASEN